MSRFQLDFIGLPRHYNLAKIKRDMAYRPVRSFAQGIMEMRGQLEQKSSGSKAPQQQRRP